MPFVVGFNLPSVGSVAHCANVDKVSALVSRKADPDRLAATVFPELGDGDRLGQGRRRAGHDGAILRVAS
jgi:hypothetical protein